MYLNFAPWRPFDVAQDMLGAIDFLAVVLFNIRRVRILNTMALGVICNRLE